VGDGAPLQKNFLRRKIQRCLRIALSVGLGHAGRGVNYAENSFMKWATGVFVPGNFFRTVHIIDRS
jgi:hypothetical protein